MKKTIWIVVTLAFIAWAFVEQTKETPKVWVQVIGVLLFFYAMMRLSQKVNQTEADNLKSIEEHKDLEDNSKVKDDERF